MCFFPILMLSIEWNKFLAEQKKKDLSDNEIWMINAADCFFNKTSFDEINSEHLKSYIFFLASRFVCLCSTYSILGYNYNFKRTFYDDLKLNL